MNVDYYPLLQSARALYDLPRGRARFEAYLDLVRDKQSNEMRLPLSAMNPMGHDHIPQWLDAYLALNPDDCCRKILEDAQQTHAMIPGDFRMALVLADDLKGQWTQRYDVEFRNRFKTQALHKRGWIVALLWTSESPTLESLKEVLLSALYRCAHICQFGFSRDLNNMLQQEAYAAARARGRSLAKTRNARRPTFAKEKPSEAQPRQAKDVRTRALLAPHLKSEDQSVQLAAFFGDDAAQALGHRALGLKKNEALALFINDLL